MYNSIRLSPHFRYLQCELFIQADAQSVSPPIIHPIEQFISITPFLGFFILPLVFLNTENCFLFSLHHICNLLSSSYHGTISFSGTTLTVIFSTLLFLMFEWAFLGLSAFDEVTVVHFSQNHSNRSVRHLTGTPPTIQNCCELYHHKIYLA